MNNPMEGRIAKIIFDSGLEFRIDFLSENKLRWTATHEKDFGLSDVESTHVEVLGDGLIAIDWIEQDGLCVSYSVDVNAQFVKSYMSWADENGARGQRTYMTHEGPFYFIQENGERDTRPFTSLEIGKTYAAGELKLGADEISESYVDKNAVFIETKNNELYKLIISNGAVSDCKKFA